MNDRRDLFTARHGGDTLFCMDFGDDTRGRPANVTEPGIATGDFSAHFGHVPGSDLPATSVSKAGANPVLTGTRAYDAANRLTSIGYARPGNNVVSSHTYTLDAADRRTRADREDGSAWSYGYNDRDEVTSAVKLLPGEELLAGWQQEFAYDNLGNRKFAREGGDAAGASRRETVYTANALNQYTAITRPGAFDVLGRAPLDVTVTVNQQPVTPQGEFWRREVGDLPNALAAVWQSVQVDAVDPGAGPDGVDIPARRSGHRFIARAVEAPAYDLDGNLLADARWTYTWDGENRLIGITTAPSALAAGVPGDRYSYVYDSRSRRIGRTVERWDAVTQGWVVEKSERFIYDQWNVVAVLDAAGAVINCYVWGHDLSGTPQGAGGIGGLLAATDVASGRSWSYASDGNGNVAAVVDLADGTKVGRYDYDAFGRTIASWGDEELAEVNPYRFSTKPVEGTGLYYYGFRYYQPETGRWVSRDPIGERGGVNLYGLVRNRPTNRVDFLGLACIKEIIVIFDGAGSPSLQRDGEPIVLNGRIFFGRLCAYGLDGKEIQCWSVSSGGSRAKDSAVLEWDDTAVPSGDYNVETEKSAGRIAGYTIRNVPGRIAIEIHEGSVGSDGCVVFPEIEELEVHMKDTRENSKKGVVPISIRHYMANGEDPPKGNVGNGIGDPLADLGAAKE